MFLKELMKFEVSDIDIIEFIDLQITKENFTNFLDIRDFLKDKYSKMSRRDLEEELLSYESKKIALEFMNVENLALGCLSALAVITSIVGIILNGNIVEEIVDKTIIYTLLVLMLFPSVYIIIMHLRNRDKSKKLAYYNIVLDIIKQILKEEE